MKKTLFNPKDILPKFDNFLTLNELRFEGVAIGGTALVVLDIIQRSTIDVDLLERDIPEGIAEAARNFATLHGLSENWFNAGPVDIIRSLPHNWRADLEPLFTGDSLILKTLSRINLIRTKFWAMCDRMRDIDDLVAMNPSLEEIEMSVQWVKPLDANPDWPRHVESMALALKKRLYRD
jgi:hypothetical protein